MHTVRTILNEVKKIKGFTTDAQLAEDIGVPLHTMRGWIQNGSIRKQLIQYCSKNKISIDEVVLGIKEFAPERCTNCRKNTDCETFLKATDKEVTVTENAFTPRKIELTPLLSENILVNLYANGKEKTTCGFDLEGIDRIVIELRP